jgi:hypothetical protein
MQIVLDFDVLEQNDWYQWLVNIQTQIDAY